MTYEYCCLSCGHTWDIQQKITEDRIKICPQCAKESAQRLVSGGQGFQLRGNGWFKSGGY